VSKILPRMRRPLSKCSEHQSFVVAMVEAAKSKAGRLSLSASGAWTIEGMLSMSRGLVSIVDIGGERRTMRRLVTM
jgi:hypothetical protein